MADGGTAVYRDRGHSGLALYLEGKALGASGKVRQFYYCLVRWVEQADLKASMVTQERGRHFAAVQLAAQGDLPEIL